MTYWRGFFPRNCYPPGLTPEWEYDLSLLDMMDHGAREFAAGRCDGLLLKIWGTEREKVRSYMAKKHPGVPYSVTWPEVSI